MRTYNWPVARRVVVFTFLAALAVFCVVQDRVTAAGAQRYGAEAVAAVAAHRAVPPVDTVMGPAIRRSVRLGLAAAGGVLITGFVAAAAVGRSTRG